MSAPTDSPSTDGTLQARPTPKTPKELAEYDRVQIRFVFTSLGNVSGWDSRSKNSYTLCRTSGWIGTHKEKALKHKILQRKAKFKAWGSNYIGAVGMPKGIGI